MTSSRFLDNSTTGQRFASTILELRRNYHFQRQQNATAEWRRDIPVGYLFNQRGRVRKF